MNATNDIKRQPLKTLGNNRNLSINDYKKTKNLLIIHLHNNLLKTTIYIIIYLGMEGWPSGQRQQTVNLPA